MKWFWSILIIIFIIGAIVLVGSFWGMGEKMPLATVSSVDVEKYMGRWYEIARLPNNFEKQSIYGNVQADYILDKEKNYVEVLNSYETKDGHTKTAHGIAFITDKKTNSKLKVSFVPILKKWGLFSAPYYIVALDQQDYHYAMVGTPDRQYLWILSREPKMDARVYDSLLKDATTLGFKTDKIFVNPQPKVVGSK